MSIFLIAEIGINHNGNIETAKKLIDSAAEAGFNAVKFQKRNIDIVYSKEFLSMNRESPWGSTQGEQKRGLEFGKKEYDEINNHCKDRNIQWSASAWDLDSQEFLRQYNLPFNKIASPMLGHKPLIKKIIAEKIKTFISTGMSTLEEIDEIVDMFKKSNCEFELMHCNSSYPLKEEDANIRCIPMLNKRYDCKVGYSGHESSLLKVCLAAACLGATSIERHITLDRTMYGSDQAASIESGSLKNFVDSVRKMKSILGGEIKKITPIEKTMREKLRISIDG